MFDRRIAFSLLLAELSLIVLIIRLSYIWPFTVDDAYITFRYSSNLALGIGPTFNTIPPNTEGYTSFLWMIVMYIPHILRFDVLSFSKIIGGVLIFLSIIFSALLANELSRSLNKVEKFFASACSIMSLAVIPLVPLHTVSGMETPLITFLITLFIYLLIICARKPSTYKLVFLSMNGLLIGLTRPEANLLVLSGLLLLTIFYLTGDWRKKAVIYMTLFYFLPGIFYFLWRYWYYRLPFPLSFYAKVNNQLFAGASVVWEFLKATFLGLGIFVIISFLNRLRYIWLVAIPSLVFILLFVFPEHIMGYGFRFIFPILPVFASIAGYGCGSLLAWITDRVKEKNKSMSYYGLILGISLWLVLGLYSIGQTELISRRNYYDNLENSHVRLGKLLAQYQYYGSRPFLAISDSGAVPYYSKWNAVDIFSLNDVEIAVMDQRDPGYVFSFDPSLIIIASEDSEMMIPPFDHNLALFNDSLVRGMEVQYKFKFNENYYLWVLSYPESKIEKFLNEKLAVR